ncbi:MAG: EAL domain-containing protein, partial [Pseudomonadota bacterium]
ERFVPLFQPKIDMKTGRICGVEALARWQLDSGRLVSPAVFIGLAEEIGLIDKIGRQIMHRSCDAVAAWARAGHELNLAVNVSPRQFEADGLAEMVLEALANSGLSPRRLELEITESLAIEQPERVRTVLTPLRRMGIGLAVDDFGTGHSNLAILTQFEFDVFKIDRQFVSGLPNDTQAAAIIDLMLGMARSLDMKIVGEGIETKAQARFMADKGCDIGQGYLYSPPVGEAALLKMLEAQAELRARRSA